MEDSANTPLATIRVSCHDVRKVSTLRSQLEVKFSALHAECILRQSWEYRAAK